MDFEKAIKEIQDTLVVIGESERRQAAIAREHAEMLHQHNLRHAEMMAFRERTDQNLAQITDKLNGPIGYMDGLRPPPPA